MITLKREDLGIDSVNCDLCEENMKIGYVIEVSTIEEASAIVHKKCLAKIIKGLSKLYANGEKVELK